VLLGEPQRSGKMLYQIILLDSAPDFMFQMRRTS
jgi:hypothetical protein